MHSLTYSIHSQEGVGVGVERAVLTGALRSILANSSFFVTRGRWKVPLITHSPDPKRRAQWKAIGTIFSLLLLKHGIAPVPASPFLIMAIISANCLSVPLDLVALLDPEVAEDHKPWLSLDPTERVSPVNYELGIYLADHTPIQVCSSRAFESWHCLTSL